MEQNAFRGIDPSLGTQQRQTFGQDLSKLVIAGVQGYAKVKEVDKKFDEQEDAKLGEMELIAYNDNIAANAQKKIDDGYSGMTPGERVKYDEGLIKSNKELVGNFQSSYYKKHKASWDGVYDKSLNTNKITFAKESKMKFSKQQIQALVMNPVASDEDYANIYKSISEFKTGVDYPEAQFIAESKVALAGVLKSIPDADYRPEMGEQYAKGLLSYVKDKAIINEVNTMLEIKENGFKEDYSSKFKDNSFDFLYRPDGNYNVKELKNFQKIVGKDANLTTATKKELFGRAGSLVKSITDARSKANSGNAKITLTNALDKFIDSSATNGKNINTETLSRISNQIKVLSPHLTASEVNVLTNKEIDIQINNNARNKSVDLINGAISGDETAIAEYMKFVNNGLQVDIGDGVNTKNIPSSFIKAEVSKVLQQDDNAILTAAGYVETTNEDGSKGKTFDRKTFEKQVITLVNKQSNLQQKSNLVKNTTSNISNNSALSASNPDDYLKLVLLNSIAKKTENKYSDSDRLREARMIAIHEDYVKSTDKNKDEIFLKKMIAEKQSVYTLNKDAKYQGKLTKWIGNTREYAEGKSGLFASVMPNSTFDERSLYAFKSAENSNGTIFKDEGSVEERINSSSVDVTVSIPFISYNPSRVFIPSGSNGDDVQTAITGALSKFEAMVESDEITVYNTPSSDGNGVNIIIERNGTNGYETVTLDTQAIKDIANQVTLDKKKSKEAQHKKMKILMDNIGKRKSPFNY